MADARASDTSNSANGGKKSRKQKLWGSLAKRGGLLANRLADTVKEVARSPLLKQALETHARGNLPAAFWLLDEAHRDNDKDIETCVAFWDVAVAYEHQGYAVTAVQTLVAHHAAQGDLELASQYWYELVDFESGAVAAPAALVRILPTLQQQMEWEEDEKKQAKRREALLRGLRAVMEQDDEGLTTGVAMRVAELAREIDPETALRAAHHCLAAPTLHEVKRAKLVDLVLELDPQASVERPASEPEPSGPPTPRPVPAAPVVPKPTAARNHPLATEGPKYRGLSEEEIARIELPPSRSPDSLARLVAERSDQELLEAVLVEQGVDVSSSELLDAELLPEGSGSELGEPTTSIPLPAEAPPRPPAVQIRCLEARLQNVEAEAIVVAMSQGNLVRIRFDAIESIARACIADASPDGLLDLLLARPANATKPRNGLQIARLSQNPEDAVSLREIAEIALERAPVRPLPDRASLLADTPPRFASLDEYQETLAGWLLQSG